MTPVGLAVILGVAKDQGDGTMPASRRRDIYTATDAWVAVMAEDQIALYLAVPERDGDMTILIAGDALRTLAAQLAAHTRRQS